jgi:hypothetical protein
MTGGDVPDGRNFDAKRYKAAKVEPEVHPGMVRSGEGFVARVKWDVFAKKMGEGLPDARSAPQCEGHRPFQGSRQQQNRRSKVGGVWVRQTPAGIWGNAKSSALRYFEKKSPVPLE